MPTVQVRAQISTEDLLQAAKQLSLAELERFVWQIIALQAHRKAPALPENESQLLLKINQGIPAEFQDRFDELIAKRNSESLTPDEHKELLRLTGQVETLDAKRMEYLSQLALIRQTSLKSLMEELNIKTPAYG